VGGRINRFQAARPILSKDGKTLAFVRRIYDNTSLVLHDIESGTRFTFPPNTYPPTQAGLSARGLVGDRGFVIGSGNEKIAYRLLGFDQQESSSPSGVYPSYAFANNDTEVIVWAKGGKLVRCVTQHSATHNQYSGALTSR
jgi:hypothetical protein